MPVSPMCVILGTMGNVTWPVVALFALLCLPTTFLVWKGALPNHAMFVLMGAALGWITQRGGAAMLGERRPSHPSPAAITFTPEEIPTKPDGSDNKRTQPMQAKTRAILAKNMGADKESDT